MTAQPIEIERAARRARIDASYRARHPEVARALRKMRKAQAGMKERHGHKREGTLETLEKHSKKQDGALARLFVNGHLTIDQLAWAEEIRAVVNRIARDVSFGSISLETRVDNGGNRAKRAVESLGRVRAEVAYTHWRQSLSKPAAVLAMIVDDVACATAAKQFRMRQETARRLLTQALDVWPDFHRDARDAVSEEDVALIHARLQ